MKRTLRTIGKISVLSSKIHVQHLAVSTWLRHETGIKNGQPRLDLPK